MDSIRGLQFISSLNALISSSEDCTLKVWDVNRFSSLKEIEGVINYEPYLTMRGHTTPILACSGVTSHTNAYLENIVVSGSQDGTIKMWKIPALSQIEPYGQNKDYSYCFQTQDKAHDSEAVWDIKMHPNENFFLSAGADCSVALWQIPIIPIHQ